MSDNLLFKKEYKDFSENQLWEHYQRCCNGHDWTFHMADDNFNYTKGKLENDYLMRLKKVMDGLDKKRSDLIFFTASPFYNDDGTFKSL